MRLLIVSLCMLHAVFASPQLLTAKDGRVGVNFGGYEAHADIGGVLNGGPSGFLGAGASTPHGQRASAGLNGNVNGGASGVAYANAQATPNVGRGVVLSGSTEGTSGHRVHTEHSGNTDLSHVDTSASREDSYEKHSVVQKIKPPKKYHLINDEQSTQAPTVIRTAVRKRVKVHGGRKYQRRNRFDVSNESHSSSASDESASWESRHKYRSKVVTYEVFPQGGPPVQTQPRPVVAIQEVPKSKSTQKTVYKVVEDRPAGGEVYHNGHNTPQRALNIPIGILASLQKSLGGGGGVEHDSKCSGCGGSSPIDVGLNIPIGILQSLQQSLGGLHRHH